MKANNDSPEPRPGKKTGEGAKRKQEREKKSEKAEKK